MKGDRRSSVEVPSPSDSSSAGKTLAVTCIRLSDRGLLIESENSTHLDPLYCYNAASS